MANVLYLDVDDEITSAASRMRSSVEGRVALVVPHGSRLATSRINFRLLAREAQTRGRQLDIVAADGGTRALAASAGLPVFASVAEYEAALGPPETAPGAPAPSASAASAAVAAPAGTDARVKRRRPPDLEMTAVMPATPPPAGAGSGPADEEGGRGAPAGPAAAGTAAAAGAAAGGAAAEAARARPTNLPVASHRPRRVRGIAVIIAVALMALIGLVGGVAAYVFLPSAQVSLVPRLEQVGPLNLVVRADPDASVPDVANAVVPALRIPFEASVSETFQATGRRVEESAARGRVTFLNLDPGGPNVIASGSVVSTEGGLQFRTTSALNLPAAQVIPDGSGFRIKPSTGSVEVIAVRAGPNGNVPANAITIIPAGKNPNLTKVTNAAATSGGSRREFPRVAQADVDRAVEQLRRQVADELEQQLGDPSQIPDGLTVFPETRQLGEPVPSADPATFVGQEITSFQLGMSMAASVIAVDDAPVATIAETRILQGIGPDHRLIDDSVEVVVGDPSVEGESVTFPVTARASRVRILDRGALLEQIKGRSIAQARALLEPYGSVEISVWPDWVTAVPTLDERVSLEIEEPAPRPGSPPAPRTPSPPPTAPASP